MRPVSDAWERSLRGSHPMAVRARVCETFQTGTNPTGTEIPIIDGSVSIDGKAPVRSTMDIVTPGFRTWPIFIDDLFAPYGNEIYVERGIKYSDDLIEYVGLGYFRIQGPRQDDAPDGSIQIFGVDRMAAIVDARLLEPRQYAVGVTFGSIVNDLILEIYPSATIEWDDDTDLNTLTRSVIAEEDRFQFLNDAMQSRGKIWYWDHRGVLVIKDIPDATEVVYEVNSGTMGVLIEAPRSLSREGTYNAVVATGEATDTLVPVRAAAIDDNPTSPTYFYGRFGQVPKFFSSPLLFTVGQCQKAAATILKKELGLPYNVSFGTIVNAALEPFDPVLIRFGNFDAPETHILDTLRIPLSETGTMDTDTREQRVTLIGSAS
jgi:Domain of unknown function (DUF5047)